MNKTIGTGLVCLLVAIVGFAQTSTSPQGGAGIYTGNAVCAASNAGLGSNLQPCTDSTGNGSWFTVMNASLKTSNTTDLFINPSLVTGLYTETLVKGSSTGASATATATGSVAVRVLIDCSNCANPGYAQTAQLGAAKYAVAAQPDPNGNGIVFDARIQQLTATLGQVITTTCLLANNCTNEQIDLILSTTSAHSFNYIVENVGSGSHTITVQARLDASNSANTSMSSSVAAALFGVGSVIVQPVHLAPGFSF
jgi:hypothetical protein